MRLSQLLVLASTAQAAIYLTFYRDSECTEMSGGVAYELGSGLNCFSNGGNFARFDGTGLNAGNAALIQQPQGEEGECPYIGWNTFQDDSKRCSYTLVGFGDSPCFELKNDGFRTNGNGANANGTDWKYNIRNINPDVETACAYFK